MQSNWFLSGFSRMYITISFFQVSENFRHCSSRTLHKILSDLEPPGSVGRANGAAGDDLINGRHWAKVVCNLIHEQVDRCGDSTWRFCYSPQEVMVLKASVRKTQENNVYESSLTPSETSKLVINLSKTANCLDNR